MSIHRAALLAAMLLVLVTVAARTVPRRAFTAPAARASSAAHATAAPSPGADDPQVGQMTRSDRGEGGARVSVVWLAPEYLRGHPEAATGLDPQRYLLFRVVVDAPALEMSTWDLKSMIYLREEKGMEYGTPFWKPIEEGSRKAGIAAFPRRDAGDNPVPSLESRYFEIVIRDLAGAKERVFRWNLQG